jgi:hypothetical protein
VVQQYYLEYYPVEEMPTTQPRKKRRQGGPSVAKLPGLARSKNKGHSTGADRLAITFSPALAREVRDSAELLTGGNVSAWLAEAARERLRHEALDEAIAAHEARRGVITENELADVAKSWPKKG